VKQFLLVKVICTVLVFQRRCVNATHIVNEDEHIIVESENIKNSSSNKKKRHK